MGLLYEQQPAQSALIDFAAKLAAGDSEWIEIDLGYHKGVCRHISMDRREARALAYKLLALAGEENEE